jgi:hypothetical protein
MIRLTTAEIARKAERKVYAASIQARIAGGEALTAVFQGRTYRIVDARVRLQPGYGVAFVEYRIVGTQANGKNRDSWVATAKLLS